MQVNDYIKLTGVADGLSAGLFISYKVYKKVSAKVEENKELTKQTVSVENDSIYIPDAKLVGDRQNEQNRSGQIEIEAGPKQVKTVKPKNKPVKHVFKKRKGLLYRLGIRK